MALTVVQAQVISAAASGSFSSPTTAGNTVIVAVATVNTSNVALSVSGVTLGGAAGNFGQVVAEQSAYASGETQFTAIWADPDCAGGQTTVAVSGSNLALATTGNGFVIMEVAGLVTTSLAALVDQTAVDTATTGTAVSSGTTAATSQASEIAVAAFSTDYSMSGFTAGWTTEEILASGSSYAAAAYQVLTSTGTVSCGCTQGSSGVWAGCVATFKANVGTTADAGLATATATASDARGAGISTVTATAAAQDPVAQVQPSAGLATATATAHDPTVITGQVARPSAATATATAHQPQAGGSSTAAGSAAAHQAAVTVGARAGGATATATAHAPYIQAVGTARAVAAAHDARVVVLRNPENLGAVLSGTTPDAVLTVSSIDAAFTLPDYGATFVLADFGAMMTGWTMQSAPLTLNEFNDVTIAIAVTQNGSPYDLTGVTLNLLLKTAAGTPDANALVFSSGGVSPAITITNATQGQATAVIPNTDLDAETYTFYRLDVVNGGLTNTTVYGQILWTTL